MEWIPVFNSIFHTFCTPLFILVPSSGREQITWSMTSLTRRLSTAYLKDTPAAPSRRNTSKLLTSKEVDALEQLYESKKSNSTQPPSQPVRFVFDHVSISRRTPRQAAQETTKVSLTLLSCSLYLLLACYAY